MNWLDPRDVEGWLASRISPAIALGIPESEVDLEWALEQFVRAMAAVVGDHQSSCSALFWGEVQNESRCDCALDVARLLVKAMDGGETP